MEWYPALGADVQAQLLEGLQAQHSMGSGA